MAETIEQLKKATKDNKKMYMSSTAYYILLLFVLCFALFFGALAAVNYNVLHIQQLSNLIWGFVGSLILTIGLMLFFHYKFGND